MPTIKKENSGNNFVYTLRNNKGNELKVTDAGAKIISFRFRDKNFQNKFVLKTDDVAGKIIVDGNTDFDKITWDSQDFEQGVRFTADIDGKKVEVVYSISNDNELSIKYFAEGVQDISAELVFDGNILEGAEISPYAEGAQKEKISGEKIYNIIDKPAEVEFVEGMFGYDFGCPIDYYDAGLKNAADIFSDSAKILIQAYASQNKLHVKEIGGGFAIKTSDSKISDGKIQSQTVYIFKNRKN